LREKDETGRWRRRGKRTEFVLFAITQRGQPPFSAQVSDSTQLVIVDRADGGKAQVFQPRPALPPLPPSSSPFPDNRPLNSVEQRRIDRAAKTDKARKLCKNARLMDDFFGKRMGAGTVFYGESLSDMDDETYAKKVEGGNDNDARLEIKALRKNPVLVVGATGKTGQWVVTDLLSKGFRVRAFVRNLNKAEDLFGWDGSTLDVFEGNVKDLSALTEARPSWSFGRHDQERQHNP
jgi:hypothetical protein